MPLSTCEAHNLLLGVDTSSCAPGTTLPSPSSIVSASHDQSVAPDDVLLLVRAFERNGDYARAYSMLQNSGYGDAGRGVDSSAIPGVLVL